MRNKFQNQYDLKNKKRSWPRWLKISLIVLAVLAGLFILSNLAILLLYRGKVLPNYSIAGVPIGGVKFDDLDQKVSVESLLPAKVNFRKDAKTKELTPKELGVAVDWNITRQNIQKQRSWLPLYSLFSKQIIPTELKIDEAKFAAASKNLQQTFNKEPLPERIKFRGNDFVISPPEDGYKLEVSQLRTDLIGSLERGQAALSVPTTVTKSSAPVGKLQGELSRLQKHLSANITLVSGGQKKKLSRADIGGFFATSGQTLALSDTKMTKVIAKVSSEFGISAVNQSEAVRAAHFALQKRTAVEFVLAGQGARLYRYCVAAKGLNASVLPEFRLKLAAVYGDPRGWSKDGEVALVYTQSGCDFTAWLSAASQVTSFSPTVCDNYYSCRVGPNVIINYDRWMGATDPWNKGGGTLENYRVMVINHETGHWFGFGHRNCPAPGQPAPVMQQQSIDLQGCTFNPWPTAAELAVL